jgi:hypothetical protein
MDRRVDRRCYLYSSESFWEEIVRHVLHDASEVLVHFVLL